MLPNRPMRLAPLTSYWGLLGVVTLLAGCRVMSPVEKPAWPGQVNHVVLCWMKDSGDASAQQRLIEVSRSFRAIPGVIAVQAGPRLDVPSQAPSSTGPVEKPFDVGVIITFVNTDALLSYQIDPIHQHAIREVLIPYVREHRTYDFLSK